VFECILPILVILSTQRRCLTTKYTSYIRQIPPPPPPRKSRRLRDNVEKYCRAGQATDDNMAHAHCMPDTQGYKQTLTTNNTYCFSTATMFTPTSLNVTFIRPLCSFYHLSYAVCLPVHERMNVAGVRSSGILDSLLHRC